MSFLRGLFCFKFFFKLSCILSHPSWRFFLLKSILKTAPKHVIVDIFPLFSCSILEIFFILFDFLKNIADSFSSIISHTLFGWMIKFRRLIDILLLLLLLWILIEGNSSSTSRWFFRIYLLLLFTIHKSATKIFIFHRGERRFFGNSPVTSLKITSRSGSLWRDFQAGLETIFRSINLYECLSFTAFSRFFLFLWYPVFLSYHLSLSLTFALSNSFFSILIFILFIWFPFLVYITSL